MKIIKKLLNIEDGTKEITIDFNFLHSPGHFRFTTPINDINKRIIVSTNDKTYHGGREYNVTLFDCDTKCVNELTISRDEYLKVLKFLQNYELIAEFESEPIFARKIINPIMELEI